VQNQFNETPRAIRFVLVRTSHPGNIGAAARAMKAMDCRELLLVAPRRFPDAEAEDRAVGAADLLAQVRVFDSVAEAVADCHFVVATTARERSVRWPALSPKEAALRLGAEASYGPVGLLFGEERTGLTNEELEFCHAAVTIPTAEDFRSLNLASAVQIMAYELRLARAAPAATEIADRGAPPADGDDMRRFYEHLERALFEIDFVKSFPPSRLMRKLARLFNRAALTREEVQLLRGILTAAQERRRKE
jgi:TrmH family RNA methyltransferase